MLSVAPICSPASAVGSDCSSIALGTSVSVTSEDSAGVSEIPTLWKPDVNACIEKKILSDGARDEIVRRLVDILFSKHPKPTRDDCVALARKLILVYPWMKDHNNGLGPSYVSC